MNKTKIITIASTATMALAMLPITTHASATVPSKMRGAWYQNLSSVKRSNRTYVKMTTHSISYGSNASHSDFAGSNLRVAKLKQGWYRIGPKAFSIGDFKVKKVKIAGKYNTSLLQRYMAKSHYAEVFVRDHVALPLNDANYFLK
ncbi:hypothetical protein [Lentilactobacillus kisonensis]|nr:hypothetical protein [Lentilactobacillus kisonensis]